MQQRREIQRIQAQIIPIILLHLHYAWCLHVQVNLLFLFQQCLVSGQVEDVERVGIKGGALRWALRRPPRQWPPRRADPYRHSIFTRVIIYGLVTVTNNYAKRESRRQGRSPPANCEAMS